MKKTILITGISGYVGYHLAREFSKQDYDIIGIYNAANSDKLSLLESHIKGVRLIQCDLSKSVPTLPEDVSNLDCIIHCAALKGISASNDNPMLFYETNIKCLLNTLSISKPYKHFVFISTGIVGKGGSAYANSKLICEKILDGIKVKTTILRYYNPIGTECSAFIDKNNIIHTLYSCCKYDKPFNIYGSSLRDYIDIRDASSIAYKEIIRQDNDASLKRIVDIGTGKGTEIREIVRVFQECTKKPMRVSYTSQRCNDVSSSISNTCYNVNYSITETIKSYYEQLDKMVEG